MNFIDTNPDDNNPDAVTGCATLFLFFLHDQCGFSINDIINNGADTLAKVFSNLTGTTSSNAFPSFKSLVDSHYPVDGTQYSPPDDNIFPVSSLKSLSAVTSFHPFPNQNAEVTWAPNGDVNKLLLVLDLPLKDNANAIFVSDDTTVITIQQNAAMQRTSFYRYVKFNVLPQPITFSDKVVTIYATYATATLSIAIKVVRPEALVLPPLQIVPTASHNPCEQLFAGGARQDFGIRNLSVISNHQGLVYSWSVSVNGVVIQVDNTPVLSIPSLPAAGTIVTVDVTVKNSSAIQASGQFTFTTVRKTTGLGELEREVDCYLRNIKNLTASIPPWVPIEKDGGREQLTKIENQFRQVIQTAEQVIASLNKIKASIRNG
jgi:hypothetical protein